MCTLVAVRPKFSGMHGRMRSLSSHVSAMQYRIGGCLEVPSDSRPALGIPTRKMGYEMFQVC